MKAKLSNFGRLAGGLCIVVGLFELFKFVFAKFDLKFPAACAAMVFLFLLLHAKILPLKWVESACACLIKYMMFYFIPFIVGIVAYREMLEGKILKMGGALFVSVVFTMTATAFALKFLNAKRRIPNAENAQKHTDENCEGRTQ